MGLQQEFLIQQIPYAEKKTRLSPSEQGEEEMSRPSKSLCQRNLQGTSS